MIACLTLNKSYKASEILGPNTAETVRVTIIKNKYSWRAEFQIKYNFKFNYDLQSKGYKKSITVNQYLDI